MPRNFTPLALIALVVITAAIMAAVAGRDIMVSPGTMDPKPADTEEPSEPANRARPDPAVEVARRYAFAARNWTPTSYRASWERQIELAGGRYRRALIAKRPRRRELVALRQDRAGSQARVLHTARDRRVRPPSARVLVTLDERTKAGPQTIRGSTVNEVRLRRRDGSWRVVGWTALPGGDSPPPGS